MAETPKEETAGPPHTGTMIAETSSEGSLDAELSEVMDRLGKTEALPSLQSEDEGEMDLEPLI
jgi:hypothetical protein